MPQRKATKTTRDGIIFDSQLEANTYTHLRIGFPGTEILTHHPLFIAKGNRWFSEWKWKVDFYLPEFDCYVEAKGEIERSWVEKMHAISCIQPQILDRLIVVDGNGGRRLWKDCYTLKLSSLIPVIRSLKTQ